MILVTKFIPSHRFLLTDHERRERGDCEPELYVSYVSFSEACDIHFKKPLGGSEAQRSCREGLGMGCLPYKLPTSVSTPRRVGSDRAVPCRAATVSAFPRGREEGRCMVRIKPVDVSPRSCPWTIKHQLQWRRRQTGGLLGGRGGERRAMGRVNLVFLQVPPWRSPSPVERQ